MVDEEQYRRTYHELITRPCPFEKAVLSRVCGCSQALKVNIAEREAVNCTNAAAHATCQALLSRLRDNANFALGLTKTPGAMPHAKSIKIQCGGLLGLQQITRDPQADISDIHALIQVALVEFEALDQLPYPEIMRAVQEYQARQRRGS